MSDLPWYPPALPRPERANYQHVMADPRDVTRNDAGPEGFYRRFSAVADAIDMSTVLTRAELGALQHFTLYTVRQGTVPFLMPDPETHGWPALLPDGSPMLLPDGSPALMAATWLCQFGKGRLPAWVPLGNRFRVSFQILVLPS